MTNDKISFFSVCGHQNTSLVPDAAGGSLLLVLVSSASRYPAERDRQRGGTYKDKGLYNRRYRTQRHHAHRHRDGVLHVGQIRIQIVGVPRVGDIAVLIKIIPPRYLFTRRVPPSATSASSTTTRVLLARITTPNILISSHKRIRSPYIDIFLTNSKDTGLRDISLQDRESQLPRQKWTVDRTMYVS